LAKKEEPCDACKGKGYHLRVAGLFKDKCIKCGGTGIKKK
jgi:DnaJ-class molecular chaperone